ncbi:MULTISPECIES: sensor histidine kinase [Clostridium]|nr:MULTISPECIES: sensor histidine kinase [Clostridium]MCD2500639.1 GHKL domain-containing protein [Clostridium sp. NSJ-145]MDU6340112.1 GHKL domain-containing protein [Clostridium sp.]
MTFNSNYASDLFKLLIYSIVMNWFLGRKLEFKKKISKINIIIGTLIVIILTTVLMSVWLEKYNTIMVTELITLVPSIIYLFIYKKGSIWEKLYLVSTYIILIATMNILFFYIYLTVKGIPTTLAINIDFVKKYIVTAKIIIYLISLIIFSRIFKYIKLKDNSVLPVITISNIIMASADNILMNRFIYVGKSIGNESAFVAIAILISHFLLIRILNLSYEKSKKLIITECNLNKLEADSKYNKEIRTIYNEMTQWKHDWQNHINVAMYMLKEKRYEEAGKYLGEISNSINYDRKYKSFITTNNNVLNAIINSKIIVAVDKNIDVKTSVNITEPIHIDDIDLCGLLGNLLDNAIEACERTKSNRFINIKIITVKKNLIILIKNSMSGNIELIDNEYFSSKRKGLLGRGIAQINKIVDEYNGVVTRKHDNYIFETKIVMENTEKTIK